MNGNIDLTKILKDCPEGTTFWSDNYGIVQFKCIIKSYTDPINYQILVERADGHNVYYTKEGWHDISFPASCLLWPSKDQRDWSRFTAPWYENGKFDPETLKPFDKVIVRNGEEWQCDFFSHMSGGEIFNKRCMGIGDVNVVIPYNDETKHLVGTTDEAPEYYRYWEIE